eukprot:2151872-Rhodomonas_salina.1
MAVPTWASAARASSPLDRRTTYSGSYTGPKISQITPSGVRSSKARIVPSSSGGGPGWACTTTESSTLDSTLPSFSSLPSTREISTAGGGGGTISFFVFSGTAGPPSSSSSLSFALLHGQPHVL